MIWSMEKTSEELIEQKIYLIRGQKMMLDKDLAELYGVSTKRLNEQVRRNAERFPKDFMYPLTKQEVTNLKSQFATSSLYPISNKEVTNTPIELSSKNWGGARKTLHAFTEQGVAMLSSVLNSRRAIQVNIVIMRAFVKLRQILSAQKELAEKLHELESRIEKHDEEISAIFDAIRDLMKEEEKPERQIGFHAH